MLTDPLLEALRAARDAGALLSFKLALRSGRWVVAIETPERDLEIIGPTFERAVRTSIRYLLDAARSGGAVR